MLESAIHKSFSFGDSAEDADEFLDKARNKEILFLDDVGKEKFTERVASQFYDLIEHRTANMLTTVWTTNMSPSELKERLGDDKGGPTIRRLKEFSKIIEA